MCVDSRLQIRGGKQLYLNVTEVNDDDHEKNGSSSGVSSAFD